MEGGEIGAEEIDRIAKIKHTKQTDKEQYKEKPKPKSRENKQKQNTTENKARIGKQKLKDQPKRLRRNLARSTVEEGSDGRKVQWGRAEDLPQAVGYKNTKIWKTKAGKKAVDKETDPERTRSQTQVRLADPVQKVGDGHKRILWRKGG